MAAIVAMLTPATTPAQTGSPEGSPEKRFVRELERLPDGTMASRFVVDAPVFQGAPPVPVSPPGASVFRSPGAGHETMSMDTLWTDRNHLTSIPEVVSISGNGQHIMAGWWLNSPRASYYQTFPSPLTVHPPEWTRNINSFEIIPTDLDLFGEVVTTSGSLDSLYAFRTITDSLQLVYDKIPPPFYEERFAATCDSGYYIAHTQVRGDTTIVKVRNALDGGIGGIRLADTLYYDVTGLDMASNGSVLAVTTEVGVFVYALGGTPTVRDTIPITGGTAWPAAVSGNGTLIVTGGNSPIVRVWEWNGSSYVLRWQHNTMATYVTAVDISDDGSTVLAGTLVNTSPPAGSVSMFNSTSSTPLWVLTNFGDLISSVSLSSNGQVGAAACWGRRPPPSFGHILAIFNKSFWSPLQYAINDDQILNVVSFLSVELSDNGAFCVAGARATHARVLGFGGSVFAMVTDATSVDTPQPPPSAFTLMEGRPNPARPHAVIPYRVPDEGSRIEFAIYDVAGRRVRSLISGAIQSGRQEAVWDGRDDQGHLLPAGVYLYRLRGEGFDETKKILLAR